ncbi:hypothetical protein CRENBAI_010919 [Crenichthys baileyi]|uniref:Uncharacterized protein n=1 Tax=Crenichthys baileyi TaxID=28760 RepID=A0AAV9RFL3_9TELE
MVCVLTLSLIYLPSRQLSTPEQIQPWTQRPETRQNQGAQAPSKQPPGVSQHTLEHPTPDIENHQYTSRQ